jgi:hypothetical protein
LTVNSPKKGKEIAKHLSKVNLDPWYYIHDNHIRNDSNEKPNQEEKEEDTD